MPPLIVAGMNWQRHGKLLRRYMVTLTFIPLWGDISDTSRSQELNKLT